MNKLFKNEFITEQDVNINETDLSIVNFIIQRKFIKRITQKNLLGTLK